MTPPPLPRRLGARRRSDIPPSVLEQLHRGEIETITLVETLALDFRRLLAAVVPETPARALDQVQRAADLGVTQRMALIGQLLLEHLGPPGYLRLVHHRADTARGWAAYLLAATRDFSLGEQLRLIRPLANDHNPGVREWAWLALRPRIAAEIEHAIDLLEPWTVSTSPFLRRFASEITRPRGVWCAHVDLLKKQPERGRILLEPLRADPHKYVQDSVANWLNDAGKTQPEWVRRVCARWLKNSPTPATERICRRGLRNL